MKLILIGLLCFSSCIQSYAQLRRQYVLDKVWEFRSGKEEGKDTAWEAVTIPHTWNAQDGITADYYRGTGEYRYQLETTPEMFKKRAFLRFEAVSQVADVFLNGVKVGMHEGSFNAFCFEITSLLRKGKNLLEVKVSNAPDKHIAPLAGDFTIFGGIYRPVSLLLLPETCITPLDYASSGIYIHQDKVNDGQAEISVITKINCRRAEKRLSVRTHVFDVKGKLVNTTTGTALPEADQKETTGFINKLTIERPILWEGRRSPHLYRVFVEVLRGTTVVDTLSQYTGLRYFSVDTLKGFFLNGKPYKIKGVNRHQDREDKGWAITNEDRIEDMELIKEIGANGIRLAHYPHSGYFYSLCDREGMLTWAEIPLVGKATPDSTFTANIKLQLTELIRQNFNHPSIFCWSLFNELSEGDVKELIEELNSLAHREDPGRLTVAAANIENRPENLITDIMAYNTYPGWYWAQPSMMKSSVAHWNRLVGSKGIGVSEYGAGANVWHHQQDVTSAPRTDGIFHPEEWQSVVHEQNYQAISNSDFVWGSFVWNMFDFASASRHEGDLPGRNDKGLVTYDRKIRKDAFYFYQSAWSDSPVLHITSRRDIARRDSVTDIKIFSNCDTICLKVNGQDAGNPVKENNIHIWPEISLKKGENRIEVTGNKGQTKLTDQCKWILL